MDISQYAVSAEDIDALSTYQITKFFRRHKSITKDDCNRTATNITGSPVSPTLVQGESSYTVAADTNHQPKVVQFRHSALDLKLMDQARQTYGDFVPNCKSCGMLVDVYVYQSDLVLGAAFSRLRRQLFTPGMEQRLLQTVQGFARSVDVHKVSLTSSLLLIRILDSSLRHGLKGQPWNSRRTLPACCSPIIPGSSINFPKAYQSASNRN